MLGRLDFNKKNKIYINQEGLINGLRVRSGFDKNLQKNKPLEADFVGLEVPNKYVFGFGLDFKGRGRNLPHLYSYNEK